MRRTSAIVRATALEILSEPLSLLFLLSSLAIATLAPALHYHQFGEASRMARDAGFSALFLGGGFFSVFGILRSFRREIESGTLQMALAHPVSRGGFFLAKVLGAVVAQCVFWLAVTATTVTIVNGAEIGGLVALKSGELAKLWGPSLAIGVATIVLPLAIAAALNRFFRVRFVLTAFVLSAVFAFCGIGYAFHPHLVGRLVPVSILLLFLSVYYLSVSAAMSVRFRTNVAASLIGLVVLASLPAVGNYYLSEALSRGGRVAWAYVGWAALATLPADAGFVLLGMRFFRGQDIGDAN